MSYFAFPKLSLLDLVSNGAMDLNFEIKDLLLFGFNLFCSMLIAYIFLKIPNRS